MCNPQKALGVALNRSRGRLHLAFRNLLVLSDVFRKSYRVDIRHISYLIEVQNVNSYSSNIMYIRVVFIRNDMWPASHIVLRAVDSHTKMKIFNDSYLHSCIENTPRNKHIIITSFWRNNCVFIILCVRRVVTCNWQNDTSKRIMLPVLCIHWHTNKW